MVLFVGALGIGLVPFLLAVVATPFVPMLRDPLVRQGVGVVLYGALASIVPVTAYSVAVDRVMDMKFLIRTTLQYAPCAVRRLGRQPRAACLRGLRRPREPRAGRC